VARKSDTEMKKNFFSFFKRNYNYASHYIYLRPNQHPHSRDQIWDYQI